MGDRNARAFEVELSRMLADFADDEGALRFRLQTKVAWGRPLA